MRASHNRAVLAERATARLPGNPRPRLTTPGTNPAMRASTTIAPARSAQTSTKRSKGRGVGISQRDSTGRRSDWTRSPYAPRGGWR